MATEVMPSRSAVAADLARTLAPLAAARTLPAAVYVSDELYRLEQAEFFARDWVCVARAAELAGSGDYLVREFGAASIILVRGGDDVIRGFHNVCRHRGSRLLDTAAGSGLARVLCPYHSWSYNLDGTLQNAPRMGDDFCRAEFSLRAVRTELYQGFVFACLAAAGPPLTEHFAGLPDLRRYRLAQLACGRRVEYEVAANWKLICENYSECYHCAHAHPQLNRLSDVIARSERPSESGACFSGGPMKLRDGIETLSMSGRSRVPVIPGLSHDDSRYVQYYLIYPNLMLSPHPDYVLTHTVWPLAPGRTRVVCEWLFTADAVASKDFEPADIVELWDLTNRQDWALCERAQLGARSPAHLPGPYQSTEDCVHAFDRWYAGRMAPILV
jgi:glycine betaine catabolism A